LWHDVIVLATVADAFWHKKGGAMTRAIRTYGGSVIALPETVTQILGFSPTKLRKEPEGDD